MNFITCRKCGTKLVTHETRTQDLLEYKEELNKKKEKLILNGGKKAKIKLINLELIKIREQLAVARKISHFERSKDHDKILIEELKAYVTREQFLEAVEKVEIKEKEYDDLLQAEYKKFYDSEKEIKNSSEYKNSEGYTDITAGQALRKCN